MYHFIFFLTPKEKVEEYFGPFEKSDIFIFFEDPYTLANCVVEMGIFKSLTQARKNGWGGEIPRGYREWKIGKKRFYTYWPIFWEDRFTQSSYLAQPLAPEFQPEFMTS